MDWPLTVDDNNLSTLVKQASRAHFVKMRVNQFIYLSEDSSEALAIACRGQFFRVGGKEAL